MNININGKDYELKFTFNSFKYMTEFNLKELENIESQPFIVVPMVEMLLMGAINNNPRVKVPLALVDDYLDEYISENSLDELLESLMKLLEDSNFFKSLQKVKPVAPKKK